MQLKARRENRYDPDRLTDVVELFPQLVNIQRLHPLTPALNWDPGWVGLNRLPQAPSPAAPIHPVVASEPLPVQSTLALLFPPLSGTI